jgi:anti-sigma regulatory factor (Ser/Thr protein kinase)
MAEEASGRVDMALQATLESIEEAARATTEFLRVRGLDRLSFEVGLLLRETMSNAVRHGSGLDPALTVLFHCFIESGHLVLEVEDDGPGFDWRCQMARCLPGVDIDCGRGLPILVTYADAVEFNAAGNRIKVRKRV